jgi:O-antigen ligase
MLLLIGMVSTIARTAFLAVVVMLLIGLMTERRRLAKLWPLAIVLLIASPVVLPGGLGHLYHAFFPKGGIAAEQAAGTSGGPGSSRLARLSPAMKLFQAHALFGTGDPLPPPPNLAEQAAISADATPPDPVIYDDQYLTSLVGHGVFGLGAVAWLVGAIVFRLVRAARRAQGQLPLLSACAAAVAGFAVAMLTFDAFAFVQCTIFFFTIAALGLRLARINQLA